jgi:nucleoside-diphosphate-sugar epimerase
MTDALIGHSGFVGGALLRARTFDACYRSTDIDGIRGRTFDTIVCSGAPAEKWRANKDPEEDRARLATLTNALTEVSARRFVLISTVDVYPVTRGVDEHTAIDVPASQPYGLHRYELEEFCRARFEATVVRLPGLYGRGLKKNAIFDMLNDRPVDAVPGNARFQFYDVDRVWRDVEAVLAAGVATANITAEPVEMSTVAREIFGRETPMAHSGTAPDYDVRSAYAAIVDGRDGYWFDAATVLAGLRTFVAEERGR